MVEHRKTESGGVIEVNLVVSGIGAATDVEVFGNHVWVAIDCPAASVVVVIDDQVAIDFEAEAFGGSNQVLEFFGAAETGFDGTAEKSVAEVKAIDWVVTCTESSPAGF